jgi:hypothetical protein
MSDTLRTATVLRSFPGWGSRRRNGKIARLPLQTRDQINQMLEDGLPYASILDQLRHSAVPPIPYPISEMNLSNWYRGGFQAWLRQRERDGLFAKAGLQPQSEIHTPEAALASPGPVTAEHNAGSLPLPETKLAQTISQLRLLKANAASVSDISGVPIAPIRANSE